MQFLFRIPSRFVAIFIALISRSHFAMRYYLESPSITITKETIFFWGIVLTKMSDQRLKNLKVKA